MGESQYRLSDEPLDHGRSQYRLSGEPVVRLNPYHDMHTGKFTGKGGGGVGAATATFTASRVSGSEFHKGIAAARQGDKGAFLSLYSPEEYNKMKCYTAEGGRVGAAIKDHGDGRREIVSLYNNGGTRGAGMKMMDHVIGDGGNYCECFGDSLRSLYEGKGFKLTGSYEFDRTMAASDWNYEKFGTPNYYTLQRG